MFQDFRCVFLKTDNVITVMDQSEVDRPIFIDLMFQEGRKELRTQGGAVLSRTGFTECNYGKSDITEYKYGTSYTNTIFENGFRKTGWGSSYFTEYFLPIYRKVFLYISNWF